jgi:hypothetical protein
LLAQVADDRGVDVEAAGVGQAFGGEHVEAAGSGAAYHRGVEGAGSEVVHDGAATDGKVRSDRPHEIGRGRDRLRYQEWLRQAGGDRRPAEGLAALPAPCRGVGERDVRQLGVGNPLRLDGDPAQHGGDQLGRPDLAVAEVDDLLVDPALRVRLEPVRVQPGGVDGVAAGQDRAVLGGVDRRRHDRRTVEQQGLGATVGPTQHGDGIRGSEVDAKPKATLRHPRSVNKPRKPAKPPYRAESRV